ncbi:ATP-binding protein [Chengkuizengella marina]|uniref:histidine kinase n=1 Tax=Chengkuizengella marina TaxID=2507566 RepID=A0A6N9Q0Q6_9BACL|nr:ATP-binding protein [Chengkuizengella marina]NBI28887.1 GHKL domain-containing protein [Chengkuizengella marina]
MTLIDIINFTFFSMIEYFILFYFIFTIFRIRMVEYIPQIVLTSLILLYVSLSLRDGYGLETIAPISQMVLLSFLMWQLFRMKLVHAIMMSVVGFVGFALLQMIIYLSYKPDISLFSNEVYFLQTIIAVIGFVIVFIIKKFNVGYSLISNDQMKGNHSKFSAFPIILSLLGAICIGPIYFLLYSPQLRFLHLVLAIIIIFIVFKIISMKQKRLIDQKVLNKTLKAMDTGTSMINHSIKNELSKINFLVNQLSDESKGKLDEEQKNKTINQILSSTKHMNDMTVRIKEKTEDVQLLISNIQLSDLVLEITTSFQQISDDRKIQVNVKADNDIMVQGDQTHIKEVLMNIINNSFEALKKCSNPQIDIGIIEDKKYLRLYVKDNGTGIPKEIQNKVLDPFFTTKKTANNHGLGLTYSYNIMKKHNGDLKIISEEHQGTEVVLKLPNFNPTKNKKLQSTKESNVNLST